MDQPRISAALEDIRATGEPLEKALKLAGIVTALFQERGHELVVVGGSAIEFYTEGAYMSGDIDFCRRGGLPTSLRQDQDVMAQLKAEGGPRSWKVAGLFVDILGSLENEARSPLRLLDTPYGTVRLVPPELLVAERVLMAFYPQPNQESRQCALKLLAAVLSGAVPADWLEIERLAGDARYGIRDELDLLADEVRNGA